MHFAVYADADFSGLWDRRTAEDEPNTARSRTGFVIMFAGCPIIWISRLQTEISLSTTEAEYIALSESLRHVIPRMNLLNKCNQLKILLTKSSPISTVPLLKTIPELSSWHVHQECDLVRSISISSTIIFVRTSTTRKLQSNPLTLWNKSQTVLPRLSH